MTAWPVARLRLVLALLIAGAVVAAGVHWNTNIAGGSDSYGYVSQADLWLKGDLTVEQPWVASIPWPDAGRSFAPLGYMPRGVRPNRRVLVDPFVIVPTYSAGLPMLMAVAKAIAGQCGLFAVVPVLGGVLVLATYGIGSRLGSPQAGLLAAWLIATSPIVLFMVVQPMSDVPAAAAWALAFWCLLGGPIGWTVAAGASAGLAILIRPNLTPVAGVIVCWMLLRAWRSTSGDRRDWIHRAVAFVAGVAPGIAAVAVINAHLYGEPLRSGYGPLSHLFAWANVPINLPYYGRLFIDTQTPFALLGIAALLWPRLWGGQADRTWIAALFAAACAVVIGEYLAYQHFLDWTSLRFLLPVWPFVMIGFAMALTLAARSRWRFAGLAAIVLALVLGVSTWRVAVDRGAFRFHEEERRRYVAMAEAVRQRTEPNAVIFSMQQSGTLRYYAGRVTVHYARFDRDWLDRAVSWLDARGVHAYAVLEDWEVPEFKDFFAGRNVLGRLEMPPTLQYGAGRVLLFDLSRPPAAGTPAEPIEDAPDLGGCRGPAPAAQMFFR